MLKFDFENLKELSGENGVAESEWSEWEDKLVHYREAAVSGGLGFADILDDDGIVQQVSEFAQSAKGRFENVVVLGVGGSSLGAICLQNSLTPLISDKTEKLPRLTVLDNIDPVLLAEFEKSVDLKKTLFIVITKSGGTPETLSQFLYFQNRMAEAHSEWQQNFVFVTGQNDGLLRKISAENPDIPVFDIPENVGGRFSVLTVVGLLPAALIGIDIAGLLSGAEKARARFLRGKLSEDAAYKLALSQYLFHTKGKTQTVFFSYAQKLQCLSEWYRQLLAESIGKEKNRAGKKVNVGITPIMALGITDQHSQSQLYMDGPNDKLFIVLNVGEPEVDLDIPYKKEWCDNGLEYLKDVSFNKLLQTERAGTIAALKERGRPVITVEMEKLDATHLGEMLFTLEASIAYLGELFDINAYDQPGVELSKQFTKKMLTE
jgi:glucose-6-phosphate isomerase